MRIGFCYNFFLDDGSGISTQLDCDSPETIKRIRKTLEEIGHTVVEIEADEKIFFKLSELKNKIDLVFNIGEGKYGDARESWVPLACEILHIPYTHSSPTVHAIKMDKSLTKLAVSGIGVRVPKSIIIVNGKKEVGGLSFPVIIKPNSEGASIGVFDANVVDNKEQLTKRIGKLRKLGLTGTLLVEEYIEGREFTVGLLGNGENIEVLPVIEQNFDFLEPGMKPIAGYELKWLVEDKLEDLSQAYDCPAKLSKKQQTEIEEASLRIYKQLGVRDCARIDYRMDQEGRLYFLEINTLPGINPDEKVISYFPLAARKAGYSYPELLKKIISLACERQNLVMD